MSDLTPLFCDPVVLRDVKVGPDGAIYVFTDGVDASLLRLTRP
jgi:glucose/arabinose dehydrogenase